ncbi:hypothetical protein DLD99_13870 [Pseudomonas kribbensis]|uniref:Uncharacterized protein n=1 Tax=Pseudomonas kribbensis TaxID=1628086 RepID=A0A345RQE8_9PSED|nr:hypothetical protein [Pseudomonas kribbensis]AXI61514.1 hypothetical protein DLD99_13870 [Pseudomonas kribbensis]
MQPAQSGSLLDIDNVALDSAHLTERRIADQTEQSNIVSTLSDIAAKREDAAPVDLHFITVSRVSDSAFDNAVEFARIALAKMLETDDFLFLAEKHALPAGAPVCIDKNARLNVQINDAWLDITHDAVITADLQEDIFTLGECAEQTGGQVFSSKVFGLEQWLNFHHYALPATVAEVRELIAWLAFQMPDSPATGDYHELLMAPADSAFHLSETDRATIRQIARDTTRNRISLLQHIATTEFASLPAATRREQAATYLDHFLQTPEAGALGIHLHDRLGWHLEQDDHDIAARQIKCLVATALILDLGFEVERHANVIAGFHLYHPDNASKTAPQVVEALEWQLTREAQLPPAYAPLAAHLLLACAAPQLLIQQTPAELTIGKPGWVIVSQAVALVELTAPGASRLMTYDRIKAFSELAPVSPVQRTLQELATITPILQWARLNGVLPEASGRDDDVHAFTTAASRFSQYVEALNNVETGIAIVPPDRRQLALQELKRVMPDGRYLEQQVFRANFDVALGERSALEWLTLFFPSSLGNVQNTSAVGRLRVSILDLYMSDDLVVNGKLTDKFVSTANFNPPQNAFSRLGELKPIDSLFEKTFDQYHLTLKKIQASILKMAVSNLPKADRTMIANGFITLYTVRESVNPLNPFEETQRQRDAAKGRYGLIIGCQHEKAFRCYELFTLRGLCRERPELADMLRSSGTMFEDASLEYDGKDTDFQPKKPAQQWPLDVDAYLKGDAPKPGASSRVVVEKLWHFFLASDEVQPIPLFFSRAYEALADGVLGNHPVATRDELYSSLYAPTELQKIRASNNQINETVINVIVPFKKCIEDIRSGDAERVSEGIGGCILDGLALLGLVVGFGATVVGIVGKTTSTTAKALSIAKAGVHLSVSLFNPLDGLPALAVQGGRLAKRGVLLLSKHGLNVVETATGQLRKLTGSAQSYDLIKAAQKTDVFQGIWKAADNLGDPVDLLALQRNSDWYALNMRIGGAWGPKLKGFKTTVGARFKRLLSAIKPYSYTRAYVKKAMPLAKSKLDNAIELLSSQPDYEVRQILRLVFGNDSDEAVKYLLGNFREMRKDLDSVTLANMSFRRGSDAVAGLRSNMYKQWKQSLLTGKHSQEPAQHFIVIYKDGMNDLYKISSYDDTRIADALIHEMSHGAPATLDFYYGYSLPQYSNRAPIDAAGLLDFARSAKKAHPENLVNPHFQSAQPPAFAEFANASHHSTLVRSHPALINADSYSLAISLLDQRQSNPGSLLDNLNLMEWALRDSLDTPHQFIRGTLPINLSSTGV